MAAEANYRAKVFSMTLTNIRSVTNNTQTDLFLLNLENPRDTGGSAVKIAANGGVYTHDMWIPWCNAEAGGDESLFSRHHLAIWDQPDTTEPPIFAIWQDFGIDRRVLCYSVDGRWDPSGSPVSGDSATGGDRVLVVSQAPDGRHLLELLTYTEPTDPPGPVAFTMTPDASVNGYAADIADGELAPMDFRINGVQNVTRASRSDPWTVSMALLHDNFSGPTIIPPNTTSHAFDGEPLTGHWHASLRDENGANLELSTQRAVVNFYLI